MDELEALDRIEAARDAICSADVQALGEAERLLQAVIDDEAAEHHHGAAHGMLGLLWEMGLDRMQSYARAAEHYEHGAARNDHLSQYRLGLIHGRGVLGQVDCVAAYYWLSLACANAPDTERRDVAICRDNVAECLSGPTLARLQERLQQVAAHLALPWPVVDLAHDGIERDGTEDDTEQAKSRKPKARRVTDRKAAVAAVPFEPERPAVGRCGERGAYDPEG